jgi:hypothetical protein
MANIVFSCLDLQITLCSLQTIVQINNKQKWIQDHKGIWKHITMHKSINKKMIDIMEK